MKDYADEGEGGGVRGGGGGGCGGGGCGDAGGCPPLTSSASSALIEKETQT